MISHVIPQLIIRNHHMVPMWFHNNQKKIQSHGAHDFHINMWKLMHQDQIQSLNFPPLNKLPE